MVSDRSRLGCLAFHGNAGGQGPAGARCILAYTGLHEIRDPRILAAGRHRRSHRTDFPATPARAAVACCRVRGGLHPELRLDSGSCHRSDAEVDVSVRPRITATQRHGSKAILLHPGAGSPRKRWPLARFLGLATLIKARRLNPEFVIGPAEQDLLTNLERHGATVHRPLDSRHLLDLFRSVAAYVGNDSGASHLAAWAGLPSVVIFGPTDPARWRPLGSAVEVVQPPLECVPCFEEEATNCAAENCLAATMPEAVLGALERIILASP